VACSGGNCIPPPIQKQIETFQREAGKPRLKEVAEAIASWPMSLRQAQIVGSLTLCLLAASPTDVLEGRAADFPGISGAKIPGTSLRLKPVPQDQSHSRKAVL
jgi:hypothetical protein